MGVSKIFKISLSVSYTLHFCFCSDLEPDYSDWEAHKLAVIVPFRNRFEEMLEFVPWIHKFLNNQKIFHQIVVVNQIDTHRLVLRNVPLSIHTHQAFLNVLPLQN